MRDAQPAEILAISAALPGGVLHQPALFNSGFDEAFEERVRIERTALQFGVELDADEPRVIRVFDRLR